MTICAQIKQIREMRGMSQTQLASKIETGQSRVSDMEKNDNLSLSSLRKVADALDCRLIVSLVPRELVVKYK